ncbi:MAG: hypothetical protein RSB77_06205 [Bacilli bacterium]
MMSNFKEFIEEDIINKKELIDNMPKKSKNEISKYNQRIELIKEIYIAYQKTLFNYMKEKASTYNIKDKNIKMKQIVDEVKDVEKGLIVLNPYNTPVEKMHFDTLFFNISHYYNYDFDSVNSTIDEFIDKFEKAGIKLNKEDFNYTYYVKQYMTEFFKIRKTNKGKYAGLSKIFEEIYWLNPEIIENIHINFRGLLRKNFSYFQKFIAKKQKENKSFFKVEDYTQLAKKMYSLYQELYMFNIEKIGNIIELARNGEIDINTYLAKSKVKNDIINDILIDATNLDNEHIMNKTYDALEKLSSNLEELIKYNEMVPLIDYFREQYKERIMNKSITDIQKSIQTIIKKIKDNVENIAKINKIIFTGKKGIFKVSEKEIEKLKAETLKLSKLVFEANEEHDLAYFDYLVKQKLPDPQKITVFDVVTTYFSLDYFKKYALKNVYGKEAVNNFFCRNDSKEPTCNINPMNLLVSSIPVFEENNIITSVINKYRISNINLNEENLDPDSLSELLYKVRFLLRYKVIEKSPVTAEEISFLLQVEKITKKEEENKNSL